MAREKEQFIVDGNGKKTGVIVPINKYYELMEDLHDLAVVAERKEEPLLSIDELKKNLLKNEKI